MRKPLPLLSRVADSVYWIGRYIERAENVARFIDVNLNLRLDLPLATGAPVAAARRHHRRHATSSANSTAPPPRTRVIEFLTFDPENPNSISSCLRVRPRERAHRARDHLVRDVGADQQHLPADPSERRTPEPRADLHAFCEQVRLGCHLFQGITDATMTPQRGLALLPARSHAGAGRQDLAHPRREVLHPAAVDRATSARRTTTCSGSPC